MKMEEKAMILDEAYTLNGGISIPKLGLGTWFIDDDKAAEAVRAAVKLGYRLIDTAQAYGNERGVGEGVRTCGVPREQLFVASKIAAELKTYEEAARSIDETLEKMGLTYLDQMIIHSPQPWTEFRVEKRYFEENREVWRALEDAQKAGKVRVIGVSNFLKDDLENLIKDCRVKPMVNQILLHITGTDWKLMEFCRQEGIQVEAYSPIAHGEALKNPAIADMAKKYEVSPAQLCIRYVLQLGAVALPKTANPAHMKNNAAVDFVISQKDMDTLMHMERLKDYSDYNVFPVFSGKPLA
jgi:diketogulonate reductase-like aldo/keto reductase